MTGLKFAAFKTGLATGLATGLGRGLRIGALALFANVGAAQAQGVAFGGMAGQSDAPVEVSADNLAVNQSDGTAVFTGNVVIAQGEMRLSAPKVLVVYAEANEKIERLEASGGVTLVSGADAAEAQNARYDIDGQVIVMEGQVLLAQGPSVMSAERMTVDLAKGTAQMGGRVRTILKQGK